MQRDNGHVKRVARAQEIREFIFIIISAGWIRSSIQFEKELELFRKYLYPFVEFNFETIGRKETLSFDR